MEKLLNNIMGKIVEISSYNLLGKDVVFRFLLYSAIRTLIEAFYLVKI